MNRNTIFIAAAVVVVLFAQLSSLVNVRHAVLMLVGVLAGVVLYHAAFGFTSSWRALVTERRGDGLRAQMLMLAITTVVFVPIIANADVLGMPVRGSVAPVALSGAIGAFLFGIGMQLGGGCASGTLYTVGGGSTRMVLTLGGFIAGSVLGAWNLPAWADQPSLGPISLLERFGPVAAVVLSLALFGAVAGGTKWFERGRSDAARDAERAAGQGPAVSKWLVGPWPLVAGAIGLAVVNVSTLLLAGRPWGVTSAFALWGSKWLAYGGVDVAAWPYWSTPARIAQLEAPVWQDVTSVMNIGIVLGALLAAGLAGRFAPVWKLPARSIAAALIGGVLLGYGARLAYGCNIGAFFSGVSSSSLHGWLWFAAALTGNVLGTRLRPVFRLT